ncbi:putative methyltransferase-domain-containing protein [Trichophaea hybrida]|nr:putative methyltransferase-domain-containing protein [Trichophaea hybrida]
MQYIRFLKSPRFKQIGCGNGTISALITVCTDLGESFMCRDCLIIGIVRHCKGAEIFRKEFSWKSGMRSLKINITVDQVSGCEPMILQVSTGDVVADQLLLEPMTTVLSVWSSPFGLRKDVEAESLVERRLDLGCETYFTVWEETRDSIARHIWDGGIALSTYLARVLSRGERGTLCKFDELLQGNQYLNVLELGSGCGIVGLALTRLHSNCHVTLTDLDVATDIIRKNVGGQKHAKFRVLDWDSEIPLDISSQHFDIVIVADCMYNSDAAPSLVSVVAKVLQDDCILVVAHKKRHASEDQFLNLLEGFGMVCEGRTRVNIGEEDTDLVPEGVELYIMQAEAADIEH